MVCDNSITKHVSPRIELDQMKKGWKGCTPRHSGMRVIRFIQEVCLVTSRKRQVHVYPN